MIEFLLLFIYDYEDISFNKDPTLRWNQHKTKSVYYYAFDFYIANSAKTLWTLTVFSTLAIWYVFIAEYVDRHDLCCFPRSVWNEWIFARKTQCKSILILHVLWNLLFVNLYSLQCLYSMAISSALSATFYLTTIQHEKIRNTSSKNTLCNQTQFFNI